MWGDIGIHGLGSRLLKGGDLGDYIGGIIGRIKGGYWEFKLWLTGSPEPIEVPGAGRSPAVTPVPFFEIMAWQNHLATLNYI